MWTFQVVQLSVSLLLYCFQPPGIICQFLRHSWIVGNLSDISMWAVKVQLVQLVLVYTDKTEWVVRKLGAELRHWVVKASKPYYRVHSESMKWNEMVQVEHLEQLRMLYIWQTPGMFTRIEATHALVTLPNIAFSTDLLVGGGCKSMSDTSHSRLVNVTIFLEESHTIDQQTPNTWYVHKWLLMAMYKKITPQEIGHVHARDSLFCAWYGKMQAVCRTICIFVRLHVSIAHNTTDQALYQILHHTKESKPGTVVWLMGKQGQLASSFGLLWIVSLFGSWF